MKAFLSIVLLLAFGVVVLGNTPEEITPEQIAQWKEDAVKGDAMAQWSLGYAYSEGNGVLENDKEAVKWYRKAAEQGHAFAQFNLGFMYDNGEGIPDCCEGGFDCTCRASFY